MKRRIGVILLVFINVFLSLGCNNTLQKKIDSDIKYDSEMFNQQAGLILVNNFMELIRDNNLDGAKSLCVNSLTIESSNLHKTDMELLEYNVISSSLQGESMTVEVVLNRVKANDTRADLDFMTITVKKLDNNTYKIIKANSRVLEEIFEEEGKLKILNSGDLEAKVLVDLKNIPRDMYMDGNEVEVSKITIPCENFGVINFSLTANKIGISTYDSNSCFVGVINVDESIPTAGNSSNNKGGDKEEDKTEKSKENEDEIIGKKIIPLDVYEKSTIKSLNFLEQDSYLVVAFSEEGKGDGIRLYDIAKSKKIEVNLESIFPREKYNVNFVTKKEYDFIFEVTGREGVSGLRQSVTGKYTINLKDLKIYKI